MRLEEPHERYDVYCAHQEAKYESQLKDATCEDCGHCYVPNRSRTEWLSDRLVDHIHGLYDAKPTVTRDQESLDFDLRSYVNGARYNCCFCTALGEFVDCDDSAEDCEDFDG